MTFAYHAEPFQYQSSVNFHSNWLAKIAWHTSTQSKYIFLKASNNSISNADMESIFTKLTGFSTYKPWSKGGKLTIGLFFKRLIFCHSLNWINCTSYKCLEEKTPTVLCILRLKSSTVSILTERTWTYEQTTPAQVRDHGPAQPTSWTMPLMTAGGKRQLDTEHKGTIVPALSKTVNSIWEKGGQEVIQFRRKSTPILTFLDLIRNASSMISARAASHMY